LLNCSLAWHISRAKKTALTKAVRFFYYLEGNLLTIVQNVVDSGYHFIITTAGTGAARWHHIDTIN